MEPINPMLWIANAVERLSRRPMIYVAHPVAAQKDDTLATCIVCKAARLYGVNDRVNLHLMCEHDAPVTNTMDATEIVRFNVDRALRWWRWLDGLDRALWTMPWVANVLAGQEHTPGGRERGLLDNCEVAARCDAIMLVGSRVSRGMKLEAEAALAAGATVFRIEAPWCYGEPPEHHPSSIPWRHYL